ncbi:MAG: hypothetical protein HY654_12990 [Acidobacteria bacterium]|nr:hypothetical protein [Acidobacteriota bacterium]
MRNPFRHLGLKFVSLGIATMLWLNVSGEQVAERSLRVPLELRNIPERLEVVSDLPSTVDVRVRGASGALARLSAGDLVAVVDVATAKPGRRMFHLTPDEILSPFGVEVAYMTPPSLFIEFERASAKVVPVVPTVEGEPAKGFQIGKISASPATVEVVGPESRLQQLTEAVTEPVSVAGAAQTILESVTIGIVDPAVRLRVPLSGWVTVEITPTPLERALQTSVRVRSTASGHEARVQPTYVSVTVRGPRAVVSALHAESIEAFVDLAGLGPGQYNLPVRMEPAQQLNVIGIDPPVVRVTIR